MVVFCVNVQREGACRGTEGSAGLPVCPALKWPAEIIRDSLSEVIAIGQGRPANRDCSGINGFKICRNIPASAQQIDFVSEFLRQLRMQPSCLLLIQGLPFLQ